MPHLHQLKLEPIIWQPSHPSGSKDAIVGFITVPGEPLIHGIQTIPGKHGIQSTPPIYNVLLEMCPSETIENDTLVYFLKIRMGGSYKAHMFPTGLKNMGIFGECILFQIKPVSKYLMLIIDLVKDIFKCWDKVKNLESESLKDRLVAFTHCMDIIKSDAKDRLTFFKWFLDNEYGQIVRVKEGPGIRFNFMEPLPSNLVLNIWDNYEELAELAEEENSYKFPHNIDPLEAALNILNKRS